MDYSGYAYRAPHSQSSKSASYPAALSKPIGLHEPLETKLVLEYSTQQLAVSTCISIRTRNISHEYGPLRRNKKTNHELLIML